MPVKAGIQVLPGFMDFGFPLGDSFAEVCQWLVLLRLS